MNNDINSYQLLFFLACNFILSPANVKRLYISFRFWSSGKWKAHWRDSPTSAVDGQLASRCSQGHRCQLLAISPSRPPDTVAISPWLLTRHIFRPLAGDNYNHLLCCLSSVIKCGMHLDKSREWDRSSREMRQTGRPRSEKKCTRTHHDRHENRSAAIEPVRAAREMLQVANQQAIPVAPTPAAWPDTMVRMQQGSGFGCLLPNPSRDQWHNGRS